MTAIWPIVSYLLRIVGDMRIPTDDPLMRLRTAPKRDIKAKPVPEEEQRASKRRTFMRSKYCRVGCIRPDNACSSCKAYERWWQKRSVVARNRQGR